MRYWAAGIIIFIYLIFCWLCWRRYHRQQGSSKKIQLADTVIAYASQTGTAGVIANQTAQQLRDAGKECSVLTLNQLTPTLLAEVKTLLIIASTYGEGEAPDSGNRFIPRLLKFNNASLPHLQVAILGLGDSNYEFFCGFAHQLYAALHHHGAHFLTDVIEVDQLDKSALRHWQYYLGQISGKSHYADWSKPDYEEWQIIARTCINPGSPGAPAFHLKLAPLNSEIEKDAWCAGDIVEIGPGNGIAQIQHFLQQLGRNSIDPERLQYRRLPVDANTLETLRRLNEADLIAALPDLPKREYSIASVPSENSLDLLVRQVAFANDQYGIGSGWLTVYAKLFQPIRLRVRSNSHFHSPEQCPLILIGNGTGIAGLRSHLANPARAGTRNWLLFGERTATADCFFNDDILRWQKSGLLERVDRVFSRDAPAGAPRYVQDLLLPNSIEIHRWVEQGAAIFVCGNLHGMAHAVDEFLGQIIGKDELENMADTRRYCRDVY